jgi:holo-[acyl-carrier protein] synthase
MTVKKQHQAFRGFPGSLGAGEKRNRRVIMTMGIGVDIIAISRMKDILETTGKVFMDKVFTPWEQQRAEAHPDIAAYAAMTFAAKEAIFKTFGIGWQYGVQMTEIEIRDGEHGEPIPVLTGKFAELATERGVSHVLLSLSYDGDYAVAVAALSGGQ